MPNPFSPWRAVFGRRGKPKDDGPTGSPSRYPWDPQSTIRGNLAIGSLRESLLKTLATDRGVHVETLLAATGALMGYAALNAALARAAERGDVVPENALVLVSTRDGRRFFFGDWPNLHLFEERESEIPLFRAVGAAALTLGLPRESCPIPARSPATSPARWATRASACCGHRRSISRTSPRPRSS